MDNCPVLCICVHGVRVSINKSVQKDDFWYSIELQNSAIGERGGTRKRHDNRFHPRRKLNSNVIKYACRQQRRQSTVAFALIVIAFMLFEAKLD